VIMILLKWRAKGKTGFNYFFITRWITWIIFYSKKWECGQRIYRWWCGWKIWDKKNNQKRCYKLKFYSKFQLGSLGVVYLCQHLQTRESKAVKVFFTGDEKVHRFLYCFDVQLCLAKTVEKNRY
jgi:hypothetical protein